jgi:hypothetical protein
MNWQAAILAHFTPKREPMLLVVDPDNLLRDDTLLAEIQNQNYDVLELQDEVTFRNQFERRYRSQWDEGKARYVVVIVHTHEQGRHIPYDLWQKSKRIELSVSSLFPNLNAIVVRELDNAFYTDLYPAHQQLVANHEIRHGERQTIEFILQTVFQLDPYAASDSARWIEFLIHKHYSARDLPAALENYVLVNLLPKVAHSGLKPEFLSEKSGFYTWLGEQWAQFVKAELGGESLPVINLADLRLRPLLAHLFAENLIPRVLAPALFVQDENSWLAIGLSGGRAGREVKESQIEQDVYNLNARLERFQILEQTTLPSGNTDLRDWLNLAVEWSELVYQANSLPIEAYSQVGPNLRSTRKTLDDHFWSFLQARYSAVDYYQDNKGPISLTGVNRWIHQETTPEHRVALICFDGMALDQWYLLRNHLLSRLPDLMFDENRTYAILPTITPVSRQALFAGKPPASFAETIHKTDRDAQHWQAYWSNRNIPSKRIAFLTLKANETNWSQLRELVDSKNLRLGILINLFDQVMHHTKEMTLQADKRVYYTTINGQLENSQLEHLFELLLAGGYRNFVTSDHGNVAGIGDGITPPKALIESFARRTALFDHPVLAQEFAEQNDLRLFHTKSLPPDYCPVYQTGNRLFAPKNSVQLSHGGLSIEELIVPFVEVKQT